MRLLIHKGKSVMSLNREIRKSIGRDLQKGGNVNLAQLNSLFEERDTTTVDVKSGKRKPGEARDHKAEKAARKARWRNRMGTDVKAAKPE